MGRTLAAKVWDAHVVHRGDDNPGTGTGGTEPDLLYIDLHLVHEVTSPQAFDGLRLAGRKVRRPDRTLATADHNVPTDGSTVAAQTADHLSRVQVETLERNCQAFGIPVYSTGAERARAETHCEWVLGRVATPPSVPAYWRALRTEDGAEFDKVIEVDASALAPQVTWGTTPGMVVPVTGEVPEPQTETDERALRYMDLEPGTGVEDIRLDRVFIGSCTNSRIGDLRAAAAVVRGRRVHPDVNAMVVPGSQQVKAQAEAEGLDEVFREAGFDWRSAGCSMCLGMNPDILQPGERCASTSNRNFEGRQGRGGRTHLVSPEMAAAAAIEGHFVDIRSWS